MNNSVMSAQKEAVNEAATPEQLVQILERELASRRSHRPWTSRNRATILMVGVLFIMIAAGAAFLVLDHMLQDLRQSGELPHSASAPVQTNF